MVFEGAKQFRKPIGDYAIYKAVQLKLKSDESHRVRFKCKKKGYEWLLSASKDKDSSGFIVKIYQLKYRCMRIEISYVLISL